MEQAAEQRKTEPAIRPLGPSPGKTRTLGVPLALDVRRQRGDDSVALHDL